jgi:ABC-type sugar transport system substrate-binding protein
MRLNRNVFSAVTAICLGVALAACGSGGTEKSGGGSALSVKYARGTIDVSSRIADKIKAKKELNFVLSYPYITIAGASQQLQVGAELAAAELKQKYGVPIKIQVIGVPQPDAPTQIGQITAKLNADQIDCLGVLPTPPGAFTRVINGTIDKGIPVFTVNGDTDQSKRIGTSTANDNSDVNAPSAIGQVAAKAAIDWAEKSGQTFNGKQVALVTGDSSAPWAQGRVEAFMLGLKKKYPSVQFIGSPKDAYMMGFAADALSKLQSFASGHKDVFFYFSTDQGGIQVGQVIKRNGLKGKVSGIGINMSSGYVPLLRGDYVTATVDQRYDLQGGNWVKMCGQVLFDQKAPAEYNFVQPSVWTGANLDEALQLYAKIPHNGVTTD